jgi:DNA polymerase V
MKVTDIIQLDSKFNFEAPIYSASGKIKNQMLDALKKETIDLNKLLLGNPKDKYLVRVSGESMIGDKIYDGDILIVDKAKNPKEGDIVVSSLNGEVTVKTFKVIEGKGYLISSNQKFFPIEIGDGFQFEIQGIVKHVIHTT